MSFLHIDFRLGKFRPRGWLSASRHLKEMSVFRWHSLPIVVGAMIAMIGTGTAAPPTTGISAQPEISRKALEAKIEAIKADEELDVSMSAQLVELYRKALQLQETANSHQAAAKAFEEAKRSAPAEAAKLRQQLEQADTTPITAESLGVSDETVLAELQQRLVKEQANLAAVEAKLADLENRIQVETDRPNAVREKLAEVTASQQNVSAELEAAPPPTEPPARTEARRLVLELRRKALSADIRMLDQELLSQTARMELLKASRDWTAHSVSRIDARVGLLQELVNQRRRAEAEKARADALAAEEEAAGKHPAVRALAERNAALTRDLAAVATDLEQATAEQDAIKTQARQIEQDFQSARQKLEVAGLSQALGRVLLEQRNRLPDVGRYRKDAAGRRKKIAAVGLAQVQIDEERRGLRDLGRTAEAMIAAAADEMELTEAEEQNLAEELRQLLKNRTALLDRAAASYGTYLRALGELDFAERQLVERAEAYAAFLDERLLWMPSARPVGLGTLGNLLPAARWLLSPRGWGETLGTLAQEARRHLLVFAMVLAIFGVLLWSRTRLQGALAGLADRVGKIASDRFPFTLQGLGITLLLAAPWPLLMGFLGARLHTSPEAEEFARSAGWGLALTAQMLFQLRAFLLLCAPKGVAEAHFRWKGHTLTALRRELRRLTAVGLPAVFVAAAMSRYAPEAYRGSLGRLAYVVFLVAVSIFAWRILDPESGLARSYVQRGARGVVARTRHLWRPLAVGTPLALAALALSGYFLTSARLTGELIDTAWLVLAAVIVHDLVIRWLVIARKRLALQRARERREAATAAEGAAEPVQAAEGGAAAVEIPEVDLAAVGAQARSLLRIFVGWSVVVGLWMIWSDVLPAFGFLDTVSLWHQTVVVDGAETLRPVTLADLLLAFVFGIVTVAAARNIPGVLEIAFLQRLSIEPGSRYAISTLARYTIFAIGIVLVFGAIGGSWSQIQWLVAALGVGLGFGLQEIFANFISGLIILFERPVRLGDTVTVGDLTGIIQQVHIRATTIRDWDRKEILVPNKALITDRVINWTLSDPITRIVIPVGIAYGSDTALAHQVMLETARSLPLVLEEPEPQVFFIGFGESSLDFSVRVFASQLADRMPLTHEVHMAIERALNENGIEIPFPQRDLHVRSGPQRWYEDTDAKPGAQGTDDAAPEKPKRVRPATGAEPRAVKTPGRKH